MWPGGDPTWPGPSDPLAYFREIPRDFVTDPTQMVWTERESVDVPSSSQNPLSPINPKYMAIRAHVSQGGADRYISLLGAQRRVLLDRAAGRRESATRPERGTRAAGRRGLQRHPGRQRELGSQRHPVTYQWRQVLGPAVTLSSLTASRPTFVAPTGLSVDTTLEFELVVSDGTLASVPDGVRIIVRSALNPPTFGPNVAPLASFSASSQRTGQSASKVADGFIDRYPGDETREWVTQGEGVGAWIQMNWSSPHTIGRVVLYRSAGPG